ncbi:beta-lactamase family protein [Bacillus atrophaeus]|uniref:serine hydrolase domain-containing protein n=1 Tax=Bacillus atrophaeus TaxID=1452 RepID=UPI00227E6E09|nr:serine hydrolase domain-containing protein [Bacillus atrophaeus]MCY9159370.1 beta-lactamase family protein [Bacillus atrophaeus]
MTSSRSRTRDSKRRRRKLNKRGKLALFILLIAVCCIIIWIGKNHQNEEPAKSAPAAEDGSDKNKKNQVQKKKEMKKKNQDQLATADDNKNISNYLQSIGFSGTAMIVKDGKIVTNKGFGYADREHKITNNPETTYFVGSSQKALIATAVLQLEEKGLLRTSDPVAAYIEGFPNGKQITLKNLLTHTSGIRGHIEAEGAITPDDLIKDIENQGIKRQPGIWDYQDSNYSMLAYIVAKVSGESYEHYITNHIFKPAGMTYAGFYKTFQKQPYPAVGYKLDKGGNLVTPHILDLSQLYGAGDIYMSAYDMYKFDQALVDGTLYSKASFEKMFTSGSSSTYGMGFYVDPGSYSNHGVMPGYNILNSFSRSGNKFVILFSNIQNNTKLGQVNNKMYQFLNQEEAPDSQAAKTNG